MRPLLVICLSTIVSMQVAFSQINYSFTTANTTYTPLSGGNPVYLTGNGTETLADEGYVNYIPIGFMFTYNSGGSFDELAISTNGFISFSELTNSYFLNNLTSGASGERPVIAALWDDLDVSLTSNITYATTGTAPNRVFTVEWLNAKWGFGASAAAISFQIKLYETSNWIQFIYRPESGLPSSPSASIGLTRTGTGNNNFVSIGSFSLTPSISTTTEVATINTKPSSAISYYFKPGVLPVTLEYFTVTKEKEKHILQWKTLNEINNKQFNVQRSNNGNDFSTIATQLAYSQTGNTNTIKIYKTEDDMPLKGTNYYRLEQIDNDGKKSYSTIISIKNSITNWATLNIYPNPVVNHLQLQLHLNNSATVGISINDVYGKQLFQQTTSCQTADNLINIPVQNLPAGNYFIKVYNEKSNQFLIQQFIKK